MDTDTLNTNPRTRGHGWVMAVVTTTMLGAGASAQAVDTSMHSGTSLDLLDLWGSSSSDVWAVGVNGVNNNLGELNIQHYDGVAWSNATASSALNQALFPVIGGTTVSSYSFTDVYGNASDNVYAIATNNQGNSLVAHYDGSVWDLWRDYGSATQSSLYVAPGNDLYVGGSTISGSNGTVFQYLDADGAGSGKVAEPYVNSQPITFDAGSQPNFGVTQLAGTDTSNLFATGVQSDFIHYDGSQFSDLNWFSNTLGYTLPVIDTGQSASDLQVINNGDGTSTVLVATGVFNSLSTDVRAFTWDGINLLPAGTAGLDNVLLGAGLPGQQGRIAVLPNTDAGGIQADGIWGVLGTVDDTVYSFDYGSGLWTEIASAGSLLNNVFAFSDGSAFVVGDGGLILGPQSNTLRYIWDNAVELAGDHDFFGATDGPTNWDDPSTGNRHSTIQPNSEFEINSGDVVLATSPLDARSIQATGRLQIENDVRLAEDSAIENLVLKNSGSIEIAEMLTLSGTEVRLDGSDIASGGSNARVVLSTLLKHEGSQFSNIEPFLEASSSASGNPKVEVASGELILHGGSSDVEMEIGIGGTLSLQSKSSAGVTYAMNGTAIASRSGTLKVGKNVSVTELGGILGVTTELDGGRLEFDRIAFFGDFPTCVTCPDTALNWYDGSIVNPDQTEQISILGDFNVLAGGPKQLSANVVQTSVAANRFNTIRDGILFDNGRLSFLAGITEFDSATTIAFSDPFNNSYLEVQPNAVFKVFDDTPVLVQTEFLNLGTVEVAWNNLSNRNASFTLSGAINNLSGPINAGTLDQGNWRVGSDGTLSFSDFSGRKITTIGTDALVAMSDQGKIPQLDLRQLDGTLLLYGGNRTFSGFDIGVQGRFGLGDNAQLILNNNMENRGELVVGQGSVLEVQGVFEGKRREIINGTLKSGNTVWQNGRMTGTGIVQATTIQSILKEVAPGNSYGVLTFDTDEYLHGAGSILEIEIGGELAGVNMDQLVVRDDVILQGLVEFIFGAGFDPDPNQRFEFLRFGGTLSGMFSDVRARNVSLLSYSFIQENGSLYLTDVVLDSRVPLPGTVSLIFLGLMGMVLRHRRRPGTCRM